jgi:hypothetical protein
MQGSETTSSPGSGARVRAERGDNEVVLRLPSPTSLLRAMLPPDAVQHMYAAQREQLLAIRSVIDAAIARIEAAEAQGNGMGPRRMEITVE